MLFNEVKYSYCFSFGYVHQGLRRKTCWCRRRQEDEDVEGGICVLVKEFEA